MTGRDDDGLRTPDRPTALLVDALAEAISAVGGQAGGIYLRSGTTGVLRLAVLAGLPGPLFRPWWRMHADRPFPVSDAYRNRVEVVLPNATETMRRYPQFAAGLPFQFGSLCVPVGGDRDEPYGVVFVLRRAAADLGELGEGLRRLTQVAATLAERLGGLEDAAGLRWDAEPLCVRPPSAHPSTGRLGRFSWDPATGEVTVDAQLAALLDVDPGALERASGVSAEAAVEALTARLAPEDTERVRAALRGAARSTPSLPLHVRLEDGGLRLIEFWAPEGAPPSGPRPVRGFVLDPGPGAADAAADLLPEGVFCLDRMGLVAYANPRAAQLLHRPRDLLLGRPLWEGVPWLDQPDVEDHLRSALLSPQPVHLHVRRPADPEETCEGEWLELSLYPGPDVLTCRVRSQPRMGAREAKPGPGLPTASSLAPLYRPIALAIALSEAVTARQVSEVVVKELLPAFGGRRLALYLLQNRHLHLAWESGFPQGFLDQFEGVGLDARLPGVETLTSGRPLFFDSMQRLAEAYPGVPIETAEGARAFLPLIASGRPVGSCILGFERPRSFSGEERAVLTALAGLIAHALERAQRYDTEAALARGLQRALLPRKLTDHPLVATAGCYLPGTTGMEIGGDWYDVVESGDGLALVIGDVQGHGVQAAATMGQLRSAVRAFALSDRPPDEVMSGTNHLLMDLDPGLFASCCYVRLDPVTGLARIARAGHPPPLLRRADGSTRLLDVPGGVVLGVTGDIRYPVTEVRIEPGAVLALYTDGLVERPGVDIEEGIDVLRTALARAALPGTRLSALADWLTASARESVDRPDDIALLLAQRRRPR